MGNYLAAPVLVGVSMTVRGLGIWASCFPEATSPKNSMSAVARTRPVLPALLVMLATHVCGALIFTSWVKFDIPVAASVVMLSFMTSLYLACSLIMARLTSGTPQLESVLKSFTPLIGRHDIGSNFNSQFQLRRPGCSHFGSPH